MTALSVHPGEVLYTDEDFDKIKNIVYDYSGIALGETKKSLVYSRVARRIRECGFPSFSDYIDFVTASDGERELSRMIDAITTNVTNFFREGHHFGHFSRIVLPDAIALAKRGEKIRFWSAACSSGQEAYSIASCIMEACPDSDKYDIKVLATDINIDMVGRGREGIYTREECRDIPDKIRKNWMETTDGGMEFRQPVKSLVTFRRLNLLASWPMSIPFSAIFCRNVAIYFDRQTQDRLWMRLAAHLRPGGYLYIGHSEKIPKGLVASLAACDTPTTYRKESS
ncbi:chemotaxis protein [Acetobacter musti]|uniref:Chemotaxis protein methyltransferase n=1 Tax=Acetobacter musti TaxID=864732 RepID=A0ABX0JNM1_9PROT|nr:protein-glutamate O-methyltransferase [Acetobacter musti]NHN85013.1 chemotaxis protein [Acetobacter musti]